uniref:G protein-coupled receptor n=1 Tax=Heligmosomoides polygyrus TaxID=6339 RepID=A0A183FMP3_HELPZ
LALRAPSYAMLFAPQAMYILNFINYSCVGTTLTFLWTYYVILRRALLIIMSVSDQYALGIVIRNIYQNDIIFVCFSDSGGHIVGDDRRTRGNPSSRSLRGVRAKASSTLWYRIAIVNSYTRSYPN